MSQENVEMWLASIDAYNAGDFDAVMEFYVPDAEVFPALLDARPLHGHAEYKAFLEEANSAWGGARFGEIIEVTPLGADRVFYRGEWGGEGLASGIKAAAITSAVVTFRDGLIVRVAFYFDQDQALKAAGLKE